MSAKLGILQQFQFSNIWQQGDDASINTFPIDIVHVVRPLIYEYRRYAS